MNAPTAPAKVLIVDDHPLVREALTIRISADPSLAVCGEAESEDEALRLVKQINPDLMIIDISLKAGHGLELVKLIKARAPAVKMLVFSGFQESLYAERALRAGALGYLNKQEGNQLVMDAVRAVLQGKRYVSASLRDRLVDQALDPATAALEPVQRLTDREMEVFRMIGQGLTNKKIAGQLHLSTHTIDSHRENIKRKLGVKSSIELSQQATQWAMENG